MLVNANKLSNFPILSLHVGGQIASVKELIIDPNSLSLLAVRVQSAKLELGDDNILLMDSVREYSAIGMIVDSEDEFVNGEDIIRVKKVLDLNFELNGLKVITKSQSKLGKVADFVLQSSTWGVQQLIIQRPMMKAFIDPELTIDRTQIIEVDDYQVIVKDEYEKAQAKATTDGLVPDFVNPFRKPNFAPDSQSSSSE